MAHPYSLLVMKLLEVINKNFISTRNLWTTPKYILIVRTLEAHWFHRAYTVMIQMYKVAVNNGCLEEP